MKDLDFSLTPVKESNAMGHISRKLAVPIFLKCEVEGTLICCRKQAASLPDAQFSFKPKKRLRGTLIRSVPGTIG